MNYRKLSGSEDINELLVKYPEADWNWVAISWNPHLDLDLIHYIPEIPLGIKWCGLSNHPKLTWDIVELHSGKCWDKYHLNRNISLVVVKPNIVVVLEPFKNTNEIYNHYKMQKESDIRFVQIKLYEITILLQKWNDDNLFLFSDRDYIPEFITISDGLINYSLDIYADLAFYMINKRVESLGSLEFDECYGIGDKIEEILDLNKRPDLEELEEHHNTVKSN